MIGVLEYSQNQLQDKQEKATNQNPELKKKLIVFDF